MVFWVYFRQKPLERSENSKLKKRNVVPVFTDRPSTSESNNYDFVDDVARRTKSLSDDERLFCIPRNALKEMD